jgi:MFS family permease
MVRGDEAARGHPAREQRFRRAAQLAAAAVVGTAKGIAALARGTAAAARRTAAAARRVTQGSAAAAGLGHRAGTASARAVHRLTRASGAGSTGLSNLMELSAAGSAGDAFVAVALAGTLFFSVSLDQARGRIALALLVTMAPFAVLAPLIGPMLDRVQEGRRFLLAGTLLARGLLCWGMAGAVLHNDAVTLLPAAFGVLVLQKAYGVSRSAVTPRLLPPGITLVAANARLAMSSLIASTVGVGAAAGVDLIAGGGVGGAAWVLRAGTVVYLAATALSFRVPGRVDYPGAEPAGQSVPRAQAGAAANRGRWRTLRGVGPDVAEAMRANASLRAFSGFMVFFLAFLLRIVHFHGVTDKLALTEMIACAGIGGFLGTALGAGLRARRPHLMLFGMLAGATAITAVGAVFFALWAALVVSLVAAFAQVLGKLALDSTVQHKIGEEIRSSTFAASETLHQLSWVAGGLAGLAMSFTSSGVAGLTVAALGLAVSLAVLLGLRRRRVITGRQSGARAVE